MFRRTAGRLAGRWLAVLLVAACAHPPAEPTPSAPKETSLFLRPIAFEALPGWREDRIEAALPVLRRSCPKVLASVDAPPFGRGSPFGGGADWRRACAEAERIGENGDGARAFFERYFQPHAATTVDGDTGLLTGYYEPSVRGARAPTDRYRIPLYRPPDNRVSIDLGRFRDEWAGIEIVGQQIDGRVLPMPTRAEIDRGALAGRGLELVWLDDAIDAFFLHIQGSGRVSLADGGEILVGYAAKNGHPYTAIGRELIRRGDIDADAISMQTIKEWLRARPGEAADVMALNQSYVFFRDLDSVGAKSSGLGPIGAQGVPLTPGRSVAVDRAHVPLGVPLWIDSRSPLDGDVPLRRLVVAQDTGGAIRGPLRADLFWGAGDHAAAAAGRMKEETRFYLLLPRSDLPAVVAGHGEQAIR